MSESNFPLVRRGRKNTRYTAISNSIIDHPTLNPEARIALIYLLSKPDDWQLMPTDLARVLGTKGKACGRNKTYQVINELKETTFIIAIQRKEDRKFKELCYYVFDEPLDDPEELLISVTAGQEGGFEIHKPRGKTETPYNEKAAQPCKSKDLSPLPRNRDTEKTSLKTPHSEKREAVKNQRILYPCSGDTENRDITNTRTIQNTESPLSPQTPSRAEPKPPEGDFFNLFWEEWILFDRPDNRNFAKKLFRKLSPAEQQLAQTHSPSFQKLGKSRSNEVRMIPYLKEKLFLELQDAPPIDKDGDFIITPERPEWNAWLDNVEQKFGEKAKQNTKKLGKVLRQNRWPNPCENNKKAIFRTSHKSHIHRSFKKGSLTELFSEPSFACSSKSLQGRENPAPHIGLTPIAQTFV